MQLDGPAIVALREARGMSQADLSDATGIKRPALCQYERGVRGHLPTSSIHPSVGIRIARALGVKLKAITISAVADEPTEAA